MFKRKWLIVSCSAIILLLTLLVWTFFFPFIYRGSFCVEDYQEQINGYISANDEFPDVNRYLLSAGDKIGNSFEAVKLAKSIVHVEPWSCYILHRDKKVGAWMIEVNNAIPFRTIFTSSINESANCTLIISDEGELLAYYSTPAS